MPKLFVVMPFGTRKINDNKEIDFDNVYNNLILVSGQNAGYDVLRIDEVSTPGQISEQYLHQLFEADVVLGDISLPNANVFYELGIRQALATGPTLLIAVKDTEIPFDFRDQRIIFYELTSSSALTTAQTNLSHTLEKIKVDPGMSPVQSFLQKLGIQHKMSVDDVAFEHDLQGRIDRAKNALQLTAVWNWAKHYNNLPPLPLFTLSERLASESEFIKAIEVIKVAIEAKPNDFEFHRQHGWYLRNTGKDYYKDAEEAFRKSLELNPSDPETLGMLGGLLKRQGKYSEAEILYDRGAKISPENLYMRVNHAAMKLLSSPTKPDEAIQLYKELNQSLDSEIKPIDEWNELVRGEAEFVLGNIESAKKHFQTAAEITSNPNNLLSPADQLELFGSLGFKRNEAQKLASWIRTLHPRSRSYKQVDSDANEDTGPQENLPVIIHLSDIHFGSRKDKTRMHRFSKNEWSLTLKDHLHYEFSAPRSHFKYSSDRIYLVISGDLVYTGTSEEFKEVEEFLNATCSELGIPKDRVIICPGNHDIHWPTSEIDKSKRFDYYLGFLKSFYGTDLFRYKYPLIKWDFVFNSPRPHPSEIISFHSFPDDRIQFLSLNSCVFETEEHHYGYIGDRQLHNVKEHFEEELIKPGFVKIAVFHHHIHPFPEQVNLTELGEHWYDQSTIRGGALVEKTLEKYSFDLALHGHKHKAQLRETCVYDSSLGQEVNHLFVSGAGSCGVDSRELEHNIPNNYEVIEFLRIPRVQDANFLQVEWRDLALLPGSEWTTPKRWVLKG